ncbi:MAG TPA: hypothetical protein VFP89_02325 [Propionibacteriaceae bacterium]|nr:hypothetical protein [Propionibacteriaceae bacterium]
MTTTDLSELETAAAEAQARYAEAQAAAQAARDAEQARRDERAREIHRQIVDGYDDDEMAGRVEQARQEFARVFAESDIGRAWIELQLATLRHAHAAVDYNGAATALGMPANMPSRPADNTVVQQLAQIVDRAAADALADEMEARDSERAAYVAGRAEG